MSDVNLQLVKEFFELNGFMILTNRKHQLRKIGADWEYSIELLVANLDFVEANKDPDFLLEARDLRAIPRAIVDVKGWHTEVFYPSTIEAARSFFAFTSAPSAISCWALSASPRCAAAYSFSPSSLRAEADSALGRSVTGFAE